MDFFIVLCYTDHVADNSVTDAGSVVTKDIPNNMVAAGTPCRIIREITDNDRKFYYKSCEFDVDDYEMNLSLLRCNK